jgi:hypothetical protein
MFNLVVGFVLGVAVCTVGVARLANGADATVQKMQHVIREAAR